MTSPYRAVTFNERTVEVNYFAYRLAMIINKNK